MRYFEHTGLWTLDSLVTSMSYVEIMDAGLQERINPTERMDSTDTRKRRLGFRLLLVESIL